MEQLLIKKIDTRELKSLQKAIKVELRERKSSKQCIIYATTPITGHEIHFSGKIKEIRQDIIDFCGRYGHFDIVNSADCDAKKKLIVKYSDTRDSEDACNEMHKLMDILKAKNYSIITCFAKDRSGKCDTYCVYP